MLNTYKRSNTVSSAITKRVLSALIICLLWTVKAMAWSYKGHQVSACVAARHLTPTTAAEVNRILGGNTMTYVAPWLDSARNDPDYAYTTTWHYINVDADETYDNRRIEPKGDAISAIVRSLATLDDSEPSLKEKEVALKILIHVVADLHQPMHAGHKSDLGGNTINVNFMGEATNLHSVFDWKLAEQAHPDWSYTRWTDYIDTLSVAEQEAIVSSSIDDWGRECVAAAADVYDYFMYKRQITAQDATLWGPFLEQQLVRGGLRLARLLNLVLDPSYEAGVDAPMADSPQAPADVYSLDGRMVARGITAAKALETLPRGVYIHGKRKISVK